MIKKTKTKQELAAEYAITRKTLTNRLKTKGIVIPRGLLMPCDVILVYTALGFPEQLSEAEKRIWKSDMQLDLTK